MRNLPYPETGSGDFWRSWTGVLGVLVIASAAQPSGNDSAPAAETSRPALSAQVHKPEDASSKTPSLIKLMENAAMARFSTPEDSPERTSALTHCQTCHLFVEPDMLDRKAWMKWVLPRMRSVTSSSQGDDGKHLDDDLMKISGARTKAPQIPADEWLAVTRYYEENAPETPLPQSPHPQIEVGLKLFKTELPEFRQSNPATTLVKISSRAQRIYVGDDLRKSLYVLNSAGQLLHTLILSNTPTSLVERDDGVFVMSIGHFLPSQSLGGDLRFIRGIEMGAPTMKVLLTNLPRAVMTAFGDLNGDSKVDLVVCMHGDLTGRFSWFENLGDGQYQEHVLLRKAGAVHCAVHDFNRDGRPDIAVLITQNHEELSILVNDGRGNFTPHLVFKKPPVYGHNHFELADFNQDGQVDFLVTNGDNGEYSEITMKRYHGIRIYVNRGDLRFEEAFFYPLNGAVKAMGLDFDNDGDLDIAAVAWFPDYVNSPRESFVYLENHGGLSFSAATFPECIAGRWLVMDAGDLDGDGDMDIVLGSYIHGPTPVPTFLMEAWERNERPVVILRNTLR